MTFGQSIKYCFSNYATFNGRASRSQFWWFILFTTIVSLILAVPYYVGLATSPRSLEISGSNASALYTELNGLAIFGLIITIIWGLATLLPTLAVGCRRLHDTDRSGWWQLLYFLCCCIVGPIVIIVFWCLPGTPGPNRFGEGPAQAL